MKRDLTFISSCIGNGKEKTAFYHPHFPHLPSPPPSIFPFMDGNVQVAGIKKGGQDGYLTFGWKLGQDGLYRGTYVGYVGSN